MKGLIFTSFLHFVEKEYGLEIVDEVIVESAIPSGGIYTTVGDYNHTELIAMIVALSKKNSPVCGTSYQNLWYLPFC